ncbi:LuxR C-terminal-related transcriptional regulator [Zavarzinia compransoris]|uniref:HTH luxR-type domain-containing protein n=1 Tax=Zavarzinia compransoris TaxID=1264899 RepID=A0A317E4N0_9PROT|nr:LuxR C-terminal-related transcriptional regulator [Zavarzinia compransoris]PWR22017.1 hypothetical protein DKG75_08545 [Zavarzinia compransoris]TDP47243.1 ATP/maltotriose-dependent transcriptional regulator MalT [Zavarzinia compransoris]
MTMGATQTDSMPPARRGAVLARPRVAGAIAGSLARNIVTAIFAPPGSGKSRALADARADLAARHAAVAFLSCTPDCADPAVFAERLRQAVGAADGPLTPEAVIEALRPAPGQEAAYLLIDDFHHADHKPQRQLVVESFHRADGAIRVLATARHRFRCGMGSLLIDGKMEEIGLADLAYAPSEARALFAAALAPEEENALDTIIQRADGWAAALTVVHRRLARGESLPQIARDFSGTLREFTAYFEDAVALVPQETAELLLLLAPLDGLNADLAEAVTGRPAAFALMRAVDACPFVTATGSTGFRLHPLFRDYLTAVARERDPDLVKLVLMTAADWHEARRHWVLAATCRLKAGQGDEAAALLCRHADDIFAREGKSDALMPMLEHLTPTIRKSPDNLFWISRSVVFHGDFPRVAQLLADPERIFGGGNSLRMRLIQILVAFGFEEFDRVRQEGSRWLIEAADAPPIDRITIAIALAMSGMALLDPIRAAAALDLARAEAARGDSQYLRAWIAIVAALHALDGGLPLEALRRLDAVPADIDRGNAIRPTIELVRAAALLDSGAVEAAERLIDRYLVAGLRHGVADTAIAGIRVAMASKLRREGIDAALALANGLENTIEQRFGPRARNQLRLLRIDAALSPRGGRSEGSGLRHLADLDVLAQASVRHCPSIAEQIRLALARHHLAQGETRQVIAITSTIMGPAATNRRFRAHAEASILRAAAHLAEGDSGLAIKCLWAAIERAAPEGLHQCFLDNAILFRLLAPALADHARRLAGRVDPACIALAEAIADTCGIAVAAAEPAAEEDAPAEPLTPAEVKVLTLAASGLKNADIAAHMLISLPTIKWHLHNVFNKWEVKTRTAAIAKARANGILA